MAANYVDIREIAKHFSVSTQTVRNWMKRGLVPYFRMGSVVRFDVEEVNRALEQYRTAAKAAQDVAVTAVANVGSVTVQSTSADQDL